MNRLFEIKSALILLFTLFVSVTLSAQNDIAMADAMRENGKIFVVVAVIAVVFIGIIIYLITLDRRIAKMEKRNKEQGQSF